MSTEHEDSEDRVLRVGAASNPQNVAVALSHAIYDHRKVTLRAIGAGAVSQSVKAVAIARGLVAPRGFDLVLTPGFVDVESRDGKISAIVLMVTVRD